MNLPSLVFFFSSTDLPDNCLRKDGLALPELEPGGNGEGKEEADVLAGASRKPNGSLWLVFDIRRMEPGEVKSQPTISREHSPRSTAKPMIILSNKQHARGHRAQNVPGTSSVCLSLRTPKLHFLGLALVLSIPSNELPALAGCRADL